MKSKKDFSLKIHTEYGRQIEIGLQKLGPEEPEYARAASANERRSPISMNKRNVMAKNKAKKAPMAKKPRGLQIEIEIEKKNKKAPMPKKEKCK